MSTLPEPVCADCISFTVDERDATGRVLGRCRFRPEMGQIAEDLPFCHLFRVRRERSGQVKEPTPAKRSSRGGGRHVTKQPSFEATRPTMNHPTQGDTSGEISMDRDGLKQVLRELLEEETLYGYPQMGNRWEGGSLVIKPADSANQPKEVPLETFFHKIVMLRDRLRVLEAKINGNKKLIDQEKVELQGYISKIYGTLTTFNVLFQDKEDQFRSK